MWRSEWSKPGSPVHLIANQENVGFSKANNQAIRASQGRHVLLLNPDTVVREDTFRKCLAHADAHPKLGGLGVPMYDGTGKFLPESKRGLPTPWAALCRMTGLHKLAPRSQTLNAYYAGHVQKPNGPWYFEGRTCGCAVQHSTRGAARRAIFHVR